MDGHVPPQMHVIGTQINYKTQWGALVKMSPQCMLRLCCDEGDVHYYWPIGYMYN